MTWTNRASARLQSGSAVSTFFRCYVERGTRKFHCFLLGYAGFEASPATRLIHSSRTHYYQVRGLHQSLRMLGGIAAAHADREGFGDRFGQAQKIGHGWEWPAEVIRVQSRDDHLLAGVCQLLCDVYKVGTEEIRFVEADHLGTPVQLIQYLFRAVHHFRLHALVAMGDDLVVRVALVYGWLENLDALAGNLGSPQPPYQFFTLSRKHRSADDFDPTYVTRNYVHTKNVKHSATWWACVDSAGELTTTFIPGIVLKYLIYQ